MSASQRVSRGFHRLAFFLAVITLIGPASATESDQCHDAAKQYGAMMFASMFCNFPERPALMKAMHTAWELCQAKPGVFSKELARPGMEEGSKLFLADREKYGPEKACSEWDQFIRTQN